MSGNKVVTSIRVDKDIFHALKSLPYFNISKFCNNALRAFLLGEEVNILAVRAKMQSIKQQIQEYEAKILQLKAEYKMLVDQLLQREQKNIELQKALEMTKKIRNELGRLPDERYRFLKERFGLEKEEIDKLLKEEKE